MECVTDRFRLWQEGGRARVMDICGALHHVRVRRTPWQPRVSSAYTLLSSPHFVMVSFPPSWGQSNETSLENIRLTRSRRRIASCRLAIPVGGRHCPRYGSGRISTGPLLSPSRLTALTTSCRKTDRPDYKTESF